MVLALDEHDATIYTGDTLKLCANISPDSATNKGLLWTSSNPDIAAVDANGNVRGLSVGSAEILCTAADGSEVTDKCAVTVRAKVKGVTLDQSRLELVIGNGEEAATGRIDFTLQQRTHTFKLLHGHPRREHCYGGFRWHRSRNQRRSRNSFCYF